MGGFWGLDRVLSIEWGLIVEKIKIIKLANECGWSILTYQENISMLSLSNDKKERINIYLTKMTVATCIDHPKKGKTQLFRRNVTLNQLKKILTNPRQHTGKGYYTK